jgi:hypothetical protein
MKPRLTFAGAVFALLCCASCSSHDATHDATHRRNAGAPASSPQGGHDSPFCVLARQIGLDDLGVSEGNLAPDTNELLAQVDRLDRLAPADLKTDFDVFAAFEHATLGGDASQLSQIGGDTTTALQHVSVYFRSTCGVGA